MREVRIDSQAAIDAVTVKELKDWGKIPGDADDQIVEDIIKACRELQEQWVGRSYIEKTLTVHWDQAERQMDLPYGPIKSITSIKRVYEDGSLSDALVAGTDYYVSGMDFKVINLYTRWQSAGKIVTGLRATYVAGHGSETGEVPLPAPIRNALLRHVITDYDQRDDLEVYQPTLYDWVREALSPYRLTNLWL